MAGLKQALDYDYAVQRSADVGADAVQPKTAKASRSPWSGQRQRDIKKKSNRKPNAKAKRAGKRNDGKQRRQATVRTARRAATFNDDIVNDDGQETTDPLLGLGKPRPTSSSPASQLQPFVSVGVFTKKNEKQKSVDQFERPYRYPI